MKITPNQLTGLIQEAIMEVSRSNPQALKVLTEERPGTVSHDPSTADGVSAKRAVDRFQGAKEFVDGADLFVKFIANFKQEQATLANLKDALVKAVSGLDIEESLASKYANALTRVFQAIDGAPRQAQPPAQEDPPNPAAGMRSY